MITEASPDHFPLMRDNYDSDDLAAVIQLLGETDPQLTQSTQVELFEQAFSKWLGVQHSVFVNSGSSANLLSIAAHRITNPENYQAGSSEIIVPAITWPSDIVAVISQGFIPRFVDVNLDTLGVDNSLVLDNLSEKTSAVFLTHAQGFNAISSDLLEGLERNNVTLIEDTCESLGATYRNKKLGTFGRSSNFSFYYAHHLSTIEGGMICTDDDDLYQLLRLLRSHGLVRESTDPQLKASYAERYSDLDPNFIFAHAGYNVRNTEIGGCMGRLQIPRLDRNIIKRNENHHRFLDGLNSTLYKTDFRLDGASNYAFNLILNEPDDLLVSRLIDAMRAASIEFRRGSAGGGNQLRQPYLRDQYSDAYAGKLPNTDHVHFYGFYLGNYPTLSVEKIDYLLSVLNL